MCAEQNTVYISCLVLFQVGCNLKEIFLNKGNKPFLVVIKDSKPKEVQQIFIGADERELFEVADASVTTAITLLVSCYYVFNVAYQRMKYFMLFLREFILGIPDESNKNSKYVTFFKQVKDYVCNKSQ